MYIFSLKELITDLSYYRTLFQLIDHCTRKRATLIVRLCLATCFLRYEYKCAFEWALHGQRDKCTGPFCLMPSFFLQFCDLSSNWPSACVALICRASTYFLQGKCLPYKLTWRCRSIEGASCVKSMYRVFVSEKWSYNIKVLYFVRLAPLELVIHGKVPKEQYPKCSMYAGSILL